MLFKIIAKILTKLLKIIALGLLNRIIGSVFGVIKTVLLLCILVFIFSNINRVISIIEAEKLNQSFFYPKIEKINNLIIESNYRENGNEE
jgi:membrane protein required for colicin V production